MGWLDDVVVDSGKLFYYDNKDTKLKNGGDAYTILFTDNYEFIQPNSFDNSYFQFTETQKAFADLNVELMIHLAYDRGIDINFNNDWDSNPLSVTDITTLEDFNDVINKITAKIPSGDLEDEFKKELNYIKKALISKIWEFEQIVCYFVKDAKDPQPKTDFKVGDFVVNETWKFPLKITKLDSGNGQFYTVKADGSFSEDIYYLMPEKTQLLYTQPKFKEGDRILYPKTQLGGDLTKRAKELIAKAESEKLGYLVVTNVTFNKFTDSEFNYELGFQKTPKQSAIFEESECKLYEPNPEAKKDLIEKGKFYLQDSNVYLATKDSVEGIGFLYVLMEKARFFKVDLLTDSIVFTLNNASEKIFKLFIGFNLNYKQGFSFFLNGIDKRIEDIAEVKITNLTTAKSVAQKLKEITGTINKGLQDELSQIIDLLINGVERGVIKTEWFNIELSICESDASQIVSEQVKNFYDRNKERIEKLNPDFSCKIIQALVSLSDYEKCGSPSSATLTKAKTDLLSKISKLKV